MTDNSVIVAQKLYMSPSKDLCYTLSYVCHRTIKKHGWLNEN